MEKNKNTNHSRMSLSGISTLFSKQRDPRLQISGMDNMNREMEKENINKEINKVHPEVSLLRISHFLHKIKGNTSLITTRKREMLKQVQHGPNYMTALFNTKAFTLIELLVVVLIIGILAAVALPQYTKAVEKTKLVTQFNMMRQISQQEELFFLNNGDYTSDYTDLGMQNPSTNEWIFYLDMTIPNITLYKESYAKPYLRFFLQNYSKQDAFLDSYKGKWLCIADKNDSLQISICESLSGKKASKTYPFSSGYWEFPLN